MKKNKKIGIIGGVGPQASSYLYNKIMKLAQIKYGAKNNDDYPEIVLHSIPVPDFITNKQSVPRAMTMFQRVIEGFNCQRVDYTAIGSNTVHLLLPEFEKITSTPFISILSAVVKAVKVDGRKKVGILASPVTIKEGLYEAALEEEGIEIIYPTAKEQEKVERMVRSVLAGTNNGVIKQEYAKVTHSLFQRGAEGIILGCTELPLAINYEAIDHTIYDSMSILAEEIVDVYYNQPIKGKYD
ncbi:MAG TPA: amino acid racemase [Patescibacteria group bacterium]